VPPLAERTTSAEFRNSRPTRKAIAERDEATLRERVEKLSLLKAI